MLDPWKAFEFATTLSNEDSQSAMTQMPNVCENVFGLTDIYETYNQRYMNFQLIKFLKSDNIQC